MLISVSPRPVINSKSLPESCNCVLKYIFRNLLDVWYFENKVHAWSIFIQSMILQVDFRLCDVSKLSENYETSDIFRMNLKCVHLVFS